MARIVLISPYLKGGKNAAKLAQRTRYVATRPGVELLADEHSTLPATKKQQDFIARLLKSFPSCWELIEYEEYLDHPTQGSASAFIQQVRENYMEALDQKENFIDYISHRPGVQKDGKCQRNRRRCRCRRADIPVVRHACSPDFPRFTVH